MAHLGDDEFILQTVALMKQSFCPAMPAEASYGVSVLQLTCILLTLWPGAKPTLISDFMKFDSGSGFPSDRRVKSAMKSDWGSDPSLIP